MKQILKLAAAPVLVIGGVLAVSVVGVVLSVLIDVETAKDFERSYTKYRQG